MNPFFIPIYQLYLFQLENYELSRYVRLLFLKGYFHSNVPLRKSIVWTSKVKSIFFLSCVLYVIGAGIIYVNFTMMPTVLFLVAGYIAFPVFYIIAFICLFPIDTLVKYIIIEQAKNLLSSHRVKVVAVAGSYGKTTMKNILSSVLSAKFNVIVTPESVNTPVGIAQWLVKTCTNQTQIVIVEMGEHYKGDISHLSSIVSPDIAVLTGINEAHLERLKTLETSIATMFEVVEHAKTNVHVMLNGDDEHIKKAYKKYLHEDHVSFYSSYASTFTDLTIEKKSFDEKKLVWSCTFGKIGLVEIPLLGEYAVGDVSAAILIGTNIGMSASEMKKGIATIRPTTHRLEPIRSPKGALVIDDSYNGNPDGVREAIAVLSRFEKRRKIFLSPGLVEMGSKASVIHETIGRELARIADRVILIRNSVTPYIEKGLKEKKFDPTHIIWFNTAGEAHEALSGIIQENDVILFQNDWGDQYV